MGRSRTSKTRIHPLFAAGLVAAALWVNRPFLAKWFGGGRPAPEIAWDAPSTEGDAAGDAPPAPAGAAPLEPVSLHERIQDPFIHPKRKPPARPVRTAAAEAGARLPEVRLILKAGGVARASIGGRLVTVGDRIDLGTIRRIDPDGVVVETRPGRTVRLRLAGGEGGEVGR